MNGWGLVKSCRDVRSTAATELLTYSSVDLQWQPLVLRRAASLDDMRSVLVSVSALVFFALEASGRNVPMADNELAERDQTYRASNGEKFAVEHGFDYHGGDYKEMTAANLHDCINYCAAHSSCRAVSYTGKSCWLKSTVQAAVANSRVTGAVRLQYVPSPITCPIDGGNQLKQADGKKFTVECGTDRPHGDIK